jgi:hypothetical protein
MNEQHPLDFREDALRATAQALSYPPTPDLAGAVRRRLAREATLATPRRVVPRRVVWAALALAVLLAALLVAPRAEALVRALFQIGGIQIVVVTPTPPPGPAATPGPTPPPPAALLDLAGETTLAAAQQGPIPLRLPAYPADLGPPDRVYRQDLDGPAVILVWLVPGHPNQVRLALYELSSRVIGEKLAGDRTLLAETTVHGLPAVWVRGPHILQFYRHGQIDMTGRRLVDGDVLAWEEGGITYRLESTLSLDEARRVAESLAPAPTPAARSPRPTPVPFPSPVSLSRLGGETTLTAARQRVVYPIRLPTTPADLGPPDHVFLQNLGGQTVVILVWLVPGQGDQVRLALYYIPDGGFAEKEVTANANVLQQTTVGDAPALWVQGPHMLRFADPQHPEWRAGRLVDGNVLIWAQSWLTYRLETALPLEDARRIAASLR